jgi:hypothetical protein
MTNNAMINFCVELVMRATKLLCGILLLKNVLFSLSEDTTELQV